MHQYGPTQCATELAAYPRFRGKHAGKDTVELILHKDKLKGRKATYSRSVCNINSQKTETCGTRLTARGNLIYYQGNISTSTSDLTSKKFPVTSAISDVK